MSQGRAKILISRFLRLFRQVFHKASKFSALLVDNEAAEEDTEQFEGEEETWWKDKIWSNEYLKHLTKAAHDNDGNLWHCVLTFEFSTAASVFHKSWTLIYFDFVALVRSQ